MDWLKNRKLEIGFGAAAVALLAVFFSVIPFTLDDYNWASSYGSTLLKEFFAGLNGRYLGNLTVLLITRSRAARVLLMTAVTYLLAREIAKYAAKKPSPAYIAAALSLLFCSAFLGYIHPRANLFAQTVGWMSGFANYVIPVLLILVYINFADKYYRDPQTKCAKKDYVLLFLLGAASGLFVETVTLFCLGLGAAVNFYFFAFRKKKIYREHLCYLAGAFVGAVIMFSNSAYIHIAGGDYDKAQRKIGLIHLPRIFEEMKNRNAGKKELLVIMLLAVVFAAVTLVLPLAVTKVKAARLRLYSNLLLIAAMTAPMLFVNGAHNYVLSVRLYFAQYVFALMFALQLVTIIAEKETVKRLFTVTSAVLFCGLTVFFGVTYGGIYRVETARNDYIRSQLAENPQATAVEIIEYPAKYDKFVYCSDSYSYWESFKEIHGMKNTAELVPVSYEDYLQKK